MTHPEWITNFVILNLPHPNGIAREIANNPEQRKNSTYAFKLSESRRRGDLKSGKTRPKVTVPVLMFHGLADQALLPGALSGTCEWLQQDAADLVTNTMLDWLARRVPSS
jgi:alpha-beta hydrolase superfamily lysophospholipase